ncbi:MAG: uncharacterized protein A8A55_2065 [Amphiamblys sp. WSBS2006]|nr:MAG: uncharacterized protein A8A55_2065 [Amphiamblys sp. WSBS2006]
MKLVLFVSVFLGYVVAVEDASGVSGDAGGLFAEDEDKTFGMLKEIKGGMRNGEKLKDINPQMLRGKEDVGSHTFVFGKGDDADEGADVFLNLRVGIREENKTHIKDGEFDLGMIKHLILVSNAVQLLPALKIHEDNKMFMMDLYCENLSELGDLLKKRKGVFSVR